MGLQLPLLFIPHHSLRAYRLKDKMCILEGDSKLGNSLV